MILVVGATGQLGSAVVKRLVGEGQAVRALIRKKSDCEHLQLSGVELATGDLRDAGSLQKALRGTRAVIATASVVFPRGPYDFARDEEQGYENLIEAASDAGVERLTFISNEARTYRRIPTIRYKREIERKLRASAVPYTIVRSAPFMDDYFALMGSDIPLRGAQAATLRRSFWFSKQFVNLTGSLVEKYGIAMVPGDPQIRHSFIALDDVAQFLIRACEAPQLRNRQISIGGPQALSWSEVAALYGRLLERPVRALRSLPMLNALGSFALRPFSPAASNQMALLWLVGSFSIVVADAQGHAAALGIHLTSAEQFLTERIADHSTDSWAAGPSTNEH